MPVHGRHRRRREGGAARADRGRRPSATDDDETLERWIGEVHDLRAKFEPRQAYRRRPDTPTLQPHDVCALLNAARQQRGPCRIVTDVGQHQMWAAQLLDWRRPRSHLTSGGSGTMGFAVPAALGAAVACPDETIWVIVGDGGFQMTNQEIATMAQEGLTNVKIAIMNNGYLGMVRQWQQLFEGKRYSGTPLSGPDFAKLAEAYGVRGITVETRRGSRARDRRGVGHAGRRRDRLPSRARGERVPDRAAGTEHRRHARRSDDESRTPRARRRRGEQAMTEITPLAAPIVRVRPAPRKHTIVVQLHDRPGALYRAVGLIRRRDYNVASLVVGASERPGTSRMVLVVEAVDVHQVLQQLTRLVDVVSVAEIGRGDALVRETALAVVEVADGDARRASSE